MQSQLPTCVLYVQALGPTIIALAASGIAGYIAFRQWLTARNRLKLDLFDKRFAIYQAMRDFLGGIMREGKVEAHQILSFAVSVETARWLFDRRTHSYLDGMHDKATQLRVIRATLGNRYLESAARDKAVEKDAELLTWFGAQYEEIEKRFGPFMRLSH